MSKRVLVVEDNHSLVINLFAYFEARDYVLDAAHDGVAGLDLALSTEYDAIVLDWMLPRLDGRKVLNRLREKGRTTPVLMLTARGELEDKLVGFRTGADDYLTKPFALAELEARVEALIVRARGRRQLLVIGDLQFDLATQEAWRQGIELRLSSSSKVLLEELIRASPAVVRRERLQQLLWGDDVPDRDLLRSHIYELRRVVDAPFALPLIQTVPKVGYRAVAQEVSP